MIAEENWNENFMEPAVKIIKPNWRHLEIISKMHFNDLEFELERMLIGIFEDLKKKPDSVPLPMRRFLGVIRGQIVGMRANLSKHRDTYLQDLANIKMYATQDRPGGYFTEALRSCYIECQEDGGTGYKSRVLTRFKFIVSLQGTASPFNILGERVAEDVARIAGKCALNLLQDFDTTLATIRASFDSMIAQREPDPSEQPLREALQEYMQRKQSDFEEIKQKLEDIQNKDEYKR
ncbi:hypothetical protein LTR56_000459 [Elasticomyces elasticus]|nr:hypothetical protein LTR22_014187 [Elasticomyces elasticus]KAK3660701.1 hypothetical protein LTR56_000459 [Elasticomyces elasticus]KAK4922847.1 hypothetical protein LTR49_009854 [Elasticomyces elasticus]KAK5759776.1 hypothetical protein LTS12_010116 [Elasticomyces elasticus]